jgi:hypothetical protein
MKDEGGKGNERGVNGMIVAFFELLNGKWRFNICGSERCIFRCRN